MHGLGAVEQAEETARRPAQQALDGVQVAAGLTQVVFFLQPPLKIGLILELAGLELDDGPDAILQVEGVYDPSLDTPVDHQAVGHLVQPALGRVHLLKKRVVPAKFIRTMTIR